MLSPVVRLGMGIAASQVLLAMTVFFAMTVFLYDTNCSLGLNGPLVPIRADRG
jgi:hypothetical protein